MISPLSIQRFKKDHNSTFWLITRTLLRYKFIYYWTISLIFSFVHHLKVRLSCKEGGPKSVESRKKIPHPGRGPPPPKFRGSKIRVLRRGLGYNPEEKGGEGVSGTGVRLDAPYWLLSTEQTWRELWRFYWFGYHRFVNVRILLGYSRGVFRNNSWKGPGLRHDRHKRFFLPVCPGGWLFMTGVLFMVLRTLSPRR